MSNPYPPQPPAGPPPGAPRPPGPPVPPPGDDLPHRSISTGQILGGLLFIVVLVFVLENTRTVKVRLIVPEVQAPLALALLIAAVLGALIAWLLRFRRQRNHPVRKS